MQGTTVARFRLGERLAFHAVPPLLRSACEETAKAFYSQQVATDFSELVDTLLAPPKFAPLARSWVPELPVLEAAGFRLAQPVSTTRGHWVATCGVDPHTDSYWGPSLVWTIHNDGLSFWQRGGVGREPPAGDILVFHDSLPHSMDLRPAQRRDPRFDTAVWIGWVLPLQRVRAN